MAGPGVAQDGVSGDVEGVTVVFAALADDTRWAVLTRVGRAPASASALARELPVSRQAIVKHLEVLREVGLVSREQVGRELVYRALGGRLDALARRLAGIAQEWDQRLAEVKRLAEEVRPSSAPA